MKEIGKKFPGRTIEALRQTATRHRFQKKFTSTRYQKKQMIGILRKCHLYFVRMERLFPNSYSYGATFPIALVAPTLRASDIPLNSHTLARDRAYEAACSSN